MGVLQNKNEVEKNEVERNNNWSRRKRRKTSITISEDERSGR
jgi:hypothetical protein